MTIVSSYSAGRVRARRVNKKMTRGARVPLSPRSVRPRAPPCPRVLPASPAPAHVTNTFDDNPPLPPGRPPMRMCTVTIMVLVLLLMLLVLGEEQAAPGSFGDKSHLLDAERAEHPHGGQV